MRRDHTQFTAAFFQQGEAPELALEFSRLRKTLFVDILRWDLKTVGPGEQDEFDRDETCCCILRQDGEVVGGFRAIRTDSDYLAASVFPTLATTFPFPHRRDAWEISRFGVLPLANRFDLARINYALMFRFGFLRNAASFVAIADLTYERFLTSLGIRTARYGPPQPLARDRDGMPMQIVAGEIRIADQAGPRFQHLLDFAQLVEITDETLVLGRHSIPA